MQCLLVTSVFWVFEFDLFLFVHVSPHGDVKGCGGVFVETGAAVTQTGQTEHSSPKQNPNVLLRVRDGKLSISQGEVQSLLVPIFVAWSLTEEQITLELNPSITALIQTVRLSVNVSTQTEVVKYTASYQLTLKKSWQWILTESSQQHSSEQETNWWLMALTQHWLTLLKCQSVLS